MYYEILIFVADQRPPSSKQAMNPTNILKRFTIRFKLLTSGTDAQIRWPFGLIHVGNFNIQIGSLIILTRTTSSWIKCLVWVTLCATLVSSRAQKFANPTDESALELVRATRPWEFACALGKRSGLLGQENGDFEAWVYPLKILRNFHLQFKVDNEIIDSKNLARSITVHPESTTITYAWDTFSVKETLFTPVDEAGAVIKIDVDTAQPLEVEAVFDRDFQLEWPATMGGSDIEWNAALHAFSFDETQHKFTALVGSPTATLIHTEFSSNYASASHNSFGLGTITPGTSEKVVVIAASFQGLPPADVTYRKLSSTYPSLLKESGAYYKTYLQSKISLKLPYAELERAYQWAQVSVLQGLVTNPYLGTGLVAGYKESSENDQRPGYAWFFGRDALWTSLALDAEGDFATTRTALAFLSQYQRSDGKITHEIAQGASFVPWFQSMPYAYAAADATPLYLVTMADYVRHSGDIEFAREQWESLSKAYSFMVSTYDQNGFPKNEGVGHGWVEGGPLLPVKNELYQASVAVEALRSFADLAHNSGKIEQGARLMQEFESSKLHLNQAFWMPANGRYAFALDGKDKQVDTTSVLSAVPMWFGLLDDGKAQSMIRTLSAPTIQTAWGMRIIPANDPKYDPSGYHNGTVWPLFTGWASVGEYRYHQPLAGYANLRSNALLTFDGSLGHVAEVLSGSYYQTLASGSPHQIWSSAMVIAPILNGMFGLDTTALESRISLSPHLPSDWTYFSMNHVQAGSCLVDFTYKKSLTQLILQVDRRTNNACTIDFSPAISRRASVKSVLMDNRKIAFHLESNIADQHVLVRLALKSQLGSGNSDSIQSTSTLTINLSNNFELSQSDALPHLGSKNQGLRIVSQTWNSDLSSLTLDTASAAAGVYHVSMWDADKVASVEGATLTRNTERDSTRSNAGFHGADLTVMIPETRTDPYPQQQVIIHFRSRSSTHSNAFKRAHQDQN